MIDLRSDAVTGPTPEMWEAMRTAILGWSPSGEDRSVAELQALGAELTGKEAGLFVLTGTMANLVALMSYARPGAQLITEASSHILWSEEWAYAALCGLTARSLPGHRGALDPDDVRRAIVDHRFSHRPETAAVCLENTHTMAGGAVLTGAQTAAVAFAAHEYGVPLHLDGARLCNAAVALGVPIRALAAPVDSVMLGLAKGLGAPAGALLCGSTPLIEAARHHLRRLGAHSVPQAGMLAAAGLVALREPGSQLEEDHRRARLLAEGLTRLPSLSFDLASVQTNIVMVCVEPTIASAAAIIARLSKRGVRAMVYTADTVRFVVHRGVTDEDVRQVVAAVAECLEEAPCSMS